MCVAIADRRNKPLRKSGVGKFEDHIEYPDTFHCLVWSTQLYNHGTWIEYVTTPYLSPSVCLGQYLTTLQNEHQASTHNDIANLCRNA